MTAAPAPHGAEKITLSVILPTRNERSTVAPCLERLETALGGLAAEVIFVDDSDDGTSDVIAALTSSMSISLIHRQPQDRQGGLATAVLQGMRAASGDYVCVLDADLQHPPETIPDLMEAASDGADIVVASRYIPGGSAAGLGSVSRVAVSAICRRIARLMFASQLRQVRDPLSGFFVVRRDVIARARLRPIGFKILLEILIRGHWSRVAEVPYVFERRSHGSSKATMAQGWLYLRHLSRLIGDGVFSEIRRLDAAPVHLAAEASDQST